MKSYRLNNYLWITAFLFIFLAAGLFLTAYASEAATLKFIGHSFVKLSTVERKIIYIDPYGVNEFADSADVVLITHEHGDHNDLSRIRQKATCQVIRSADALQGGVYKKLAIGNIKVNAVPAYNGNHNKGACVGYVIEFDDIKIYHAGDTGKITEMADLAGQHIDYALLPMDGMFTMTPEEATEAAALIQAKHDIPIHTLDDSYSMGIVARFTSPNKLVVNPGETIELEHTATSIKETAETVDGFSLGPNYPNPFNPMTTIIFNVPQVGEPAELAIYDILGCKINTLFKGPATQKQIQVKWSGENEAGLIMPSGLYFATFKAGSFVQTIKMTFIE